jgi:hypothetical protein
MKTTVAKKWVKALRSGKFKQGTNFLKTSVKNKVNHCCLGVLCELYDQEQKRKHKKRLNQTTERIYHYVDDKLCYRIDNRVDVLPKAVQKWAGINDNSGNVSFINRVTFAYESLVDMNDGGCTFNRIAKVIEKYAERI